MDDLLYEGFIYLETAHSAVNLIQKVLEISGDEAGVRACKAIHEALDIMPKADVIERTSIEERKTNG